jgi:hypothetical protein
LPYFTALVHPPHDQAEGRTAPFRQRELLEQLGLDAVPALVAIEELVAEGFDHGVERAGHPRDVALAQQCEHRAQQAACGTDLLAAR